VSLVKSKLEYAAGSKLETYVNNLKAQIDDATQKKLKALASLIPGDSVLVEYDSVLPG
jgi:hypothetical protein